MTVRKLNKPFTFNNDLDQFFNDFFHSPAAVLKEGKKKLWGETPAVNITENKEQFDISVAVPGMKKEDFKIEIDEGVMSISAEMSEEKSESNDKFTRREFNYSSFERRFTLPENVKDEDVKATYVDGILNIVLPKLDKEEQKDKKKLVNIS